MQHFKILKILNFINAGLMVFGLLIVLISMAFSVFTILGAGGDGAMMALVFTMVINVVFIILLVVLMALYIKLAKAIGNGEGRIMQTIFAVLAITNCPLGTLYAGYALWVCWINEETVAILTGDAPNA